jgi:hypothetical protein
MPAFRIIGKVRAYIFVRLASADFIETPTHMNSLKDKIIKMRPEQNARQIY